MPETLGSFQSRLAQLPCGVGVHPDVLLGFINNRIEEICRSRPWTRLEKESVLVTVANYTTGTVSIAVGATSGTGTSTTFTAQMTGYRIRIASVREYYLFTFVDATHFTIDRPYLGSDTLAVPPLDAVNASFTIWQPIYPLPADLAELKSIQNPRLALNLREESRQFLDDNAASRIQYGDAVAFVPFGDGPPDGSGRSLAQIELYPGPDLSRGYPFRYRVNAPTFADVQGKTSLVFPDWFSTPALYELVKADLYEMKGDLASSEFAEQKGQARLAEMSSEDNRRTPPTRMQLPDEYTEHRRRRAARGWDGCGRW